MNLFINCCPREESRTKKLADALLAKLGEYEELNLNTAGLSSVDNAALNRRNELLARGNLDAPEFALARQFASADTVVMAAPYWDLSFPSKLKIYIENIYITGIVSCYNEQGMPVGLCKAEKLYYVTTAGGPYDARYSFDYLQTLCRDYFGIPEVSLVKAEMLDIVGNDADAIVQAAIDAL